MTLVCELVTDHNGVIEQVSPETSALLAIDERWLRGKPLASFVSPRDRQRFRTLLIDLGTGRRQDAELPFVLASRSGKEINAQLTAACADGDVTWRVQADVDVGEPSTHGPLLGAERLFERVLNRLPTGVLVADRDLKVVYVNPAARRLLRGNLRSGNRLPDPWPELSLPKLVESLFSHEPHAGTHLVESDERMLCVEGLPAGHAATATLLLEDVTDRERIRRVERQFVENAAHELRTPLAAIVSVVDVLQDGAKDDEAARDRFLAHIRAHSERLVRLATSLLSLARIQTGMEQPRLDLVPLRPVLTEVAERAGEGGTVEIAVRASGEVAALADRELLYQALANVAANALKHTHEGEVALEARDLGRTVEVEVRDTGRGMERTAAAHAFDRFYRSSLREDDGFGLGLAIANDAVVAMGGSIALESTPNVGTRVWIRLPSAKIVSE